VINILPLNIGHKNGGMCVHVRVVHTFFCQTTSANDKQSIWTFLFAELIDNSQNLTLPKQVFIMIFMSLSVSFSPFCQKMLLRDIFALKFKRSTFQTRNGNGTYRFSKMVTSGRGGRKPFLQGNVVRCKSQI